MRWTNLSGIAAASTLAACGSSQRANIALPDLESGEFGYLVARADEVLQVWALDKEVDAIVTQSDDTSGVVQAITLSTPPAQLGLEGLVTPGVAATDALASEHAVRSMSARYEGATVFEWAEGAQALSNFVLPVSRQSCGTFHLSEPTVLARPVVEGPVVATTLPDGSLLAGTLNRLFHFTEGSVEDLPPLPFNLHGATKQLKYFSGPGGLYAATWEDSQLTLERTDLGWGGTETSSISWFTEAKDGTFFALSSSGHALKLKPSEPPEILFDLESPRPAGEGGVVSLENGHVVFYLSTHSSIMEYDGASITETTNALGDSGVASLIEHPSMGLLAGDGFGKVWQKVGRGWERLEGSPLSITVVTMHPTVSGFLTGSGKGNFDEYFVDRFCPQLRIMTADIVDLLPANDGLWVVGRATTRDHLDVTFIRPDR